MSLDSLTTLLREVQLEVKRNQYAPALKIIRDAKIIDLHNLYLSAIEHFVATLPLPGSQGYSEQHSAEHEQLLSLMIERAVHDRERRASKRSEGSAAVPDERLVMLEKVKHSYFQRADEFIEAKEFGRAMEEIQRVYFFDPQNFVAKEYQQKIAQLADLNKK